MAEGEIKGVIWDMGGVILRTTFPEFREGMARRFGISRQELERIVFHSDSSVASELGEIPVEEHYANMTRHFRLDPSEAHWFADHYWAGDRVDEDLVAYISALRPGYKTALLSNAWQNGRVIFGERFGFLHAFDVIVYSSEVGVRKPSREIFELTAARMNLSLDECVFIDDFIENIHGARAVGLRAIQFQSRDQVMTELETLIGTSEGQKLPQLNPKNSPQIA